MLFSGPEAERLASNLQRNRGPQPIAANEAPQPAARADVGVSPAGQSIDLDALEAQQQRAQAEAQARAPQVIARGPTGGVIVRDPVSNQLSEIRPGSPGISQAQLQKKASQGVAMPVGSSESVQGGFAPNQDYLDQQADAAIDQKIGIQQAADIGAQQAREQAAHADAFAAQQAAEAQRQQQAVTEVQQLVARDRDAYQQAQADASAAKIDPDRIYHGASGTARAIGSAVAAGLGAFGAALARTPNFALDMIQRSIDRDISAQEQEIRTKKEGAQNALGNLLRSGATLDQAREMLRGQQLTLAKAENDRIAAKYKEPAVLNAAAQQSAEIDKALSQSFENYRIASQGRRTAEVTQRMVYPQAATGPSRVPLSLDEQTKLVGLEKTKAEIAVDQAKAQAGANGGRAIDARLQGQIVAARNARDAVGEVAEALGMKRGAEGAYENPSASSAAAAMLPGSDTRQKVQAAKLSLIGEIGKAQIGGVLSEGEAEKLESQIESTKTPAEIGAFIRHYDHMMRSVERNVRDVSQLSRGGPDVAADREESEGDLTQRGAD